MRYDIRSIDALIRELGGPSAVGKWLGITQEAVCNWKARDHIPPGWHWKFTAACRKRGKSIDPKVFGIPDDDEDAPFLNAAMVARA